MTCRLPSIESVVHAALGSVCTGAALRVSRFGNQEPLIDQYWGVIAEDAVAKVGNETLFDLASLTKLFTSTTLLRLIDAGRVGLHDRLAEFVPEFGVGPADRQSVTLFHLLTHTSGLPPFERLYERFPHPGTDRTGFRQASLEILFHVPLASQPGGQVVYSDIGFVLLGEVVERISGLPLDEAFAELVLRPLRLKARFRPTINERVVATEKVIWRGYRAAGEAHDQNAVLLGGVAGHAGLFGRTTDVSRLGLMYARDGEDILSPQLVKLATTEQARTGPERRGIGFKLRSSDPQASERPLNVNAFGHYGFTGTALWVDPARELVITLLTNRVYYGRDAEGIRTLRRDVFAAIAHEIWAP